MNESCGWDSANMWRRSAQSRSQEEKVQRGSTWDGQLRCSARLLASTCPKSERRARRPCAFPIHRNQPVKQLGWFSARARIFGERAPNTGFFRKLENYSFQRNRFREVDRVSEVLVWSENKIGVLFVPRPQTTGYYISVGELIDILGFPFRFLLVSGCEFHVWIFRASSWGKSSGKISN
jgi:hypothetical protein